MKTRLKTILLLALATMLSLFSLFVYRIDATSTVYIRPDGSVDPVTAPILRIDFNNTYILMDNLTATADGITIERDNIVFDGAGYTIQGSGSGYAILLSGRTNVTIRNVATHSFDYGVALDNCSYCTVSSSKMTQNNYNGIWLHSSSYNIVTANNMTECQYYGIGLDNSANNTLSYNLIFDNEGGLYLDWSSNNTLIGNNITGNIGNGVRLQLTSGNTLRENVMTGNRYNFEVFGDKVQYLVHDIDFSNTVGGKPVYYWLNESNKTVPGDAGFVALVSCNNVTVEGLNLTNNGKGAIIAASTNVTIASNRIASNVWGVSVIESSDISIVGNQIVGNSFYGVEMSRCLRSNISGNVVSGSLYVGVRLDDLSFACFDDNLVTGNHRGVEVSGTRNVLSKNRISSNGENGIRLADLANSSIFGNDISGNAVGIELYYSSDNVMYNNNFIGNTKHVNILAQATANFWEAAYPLGGNYWPASLKTDFRRGVDQTEVGSDGLADVPYMIEGNISDNFPLAGLFYVFEAYEAYDVEVISNSSVLELKYFESNRTIVIHAQNATSQRFGFVRACIPHALMDFSSLTVLIDGGETPVAYLEGELHDNATHRWICFSYEEPAQEIQIIPELSFLAAVIATIAAGSPLLLAAKKRAESK